MIVVFMTGLIWQTLVIVHFYTFREQIAAIHCVEKDKPESTCKGSCHLKEQLTVPSSTEETEKGINLSSETGLILLLGFTPSYHELISSPNLSNIENPIYIKTAVKNFQSSIFHPPQFV